MEKVAQKNEQAKAQATAAVETKAAETTGKAQATAAVEIKAAETTGKTAEEIAAFKAKKAEAAKKFAARQAAAKEERQKKAAAFLKYIADNKVKVPQEHLDLLNELANPAARSNNTSSFFNKVFGDSPKAGDKITLIEYMKKTLRAKKDIDKAIENWKKSGIEVKFNQAANMLESTYEVVKC